MGGDLSFIPPSPFFTEFRFIANKFAEISTPKPKEITYEALVKIPSFQYIFLATQLDCPEKVLLSHFNNKIVVCCPLQFLSLPISCFLFRDFYNIPCLLLNIHSYTYAIIIMLLVSKKYDMSINQLLFLLCSLEKENIPIFQPNQPHKLKWMQKYLSTAFEDYNKRQMVICKFSDLMEGSHIINYSIFSKALREFINSDSSFSTSIVIISEPIFNDSSTDNQNDYFMNSPSSSISDMIVSEPLEFDNSYSYDSCSIDLNVSEPKYDQSESNSNSQQICEFDSNFQLDSKSNDENPSLKFAQFDSVSFASSSEQDD